MSDEYGAELLVESEIIEGTWTYNGQVKKLKVEDISQGSAELLKQYMKVAGMAMNLDDDEVDEEKLEAVNKEAEDLDELPWEGDTEHDSVIECTIEAKLVRPDVPVSDMRSPKAKAVFEGMWEAWQEGNR